MAWTSVQLRAALPLSALLLASWPGVARSAWPQDPNSVGVALASPPAPAQNHVAISDGVGGVIVTWDDLRGPRDHHVYAQRVDASGIVQWAAGGVGIFTAANIDEVPSIASDGAGGAIVACSDMRNHSPTDYPNHDVYVQRVNASGIPQWPTNGVPLCTARYSQWITAIVPDGVGGAIITWEDNRNGWDTDIYAQRVDSTGVPLWTPDGVAVCTAPHNQTEVSIVSDAEGGAIIIWQDLRNGSPDSLGRIRRNVDIYAQRIDAGGVPRWSNNGVAICIAADDQNEPRAVMDDAGGAIVAWSDRRSGTNTDIYAQRISRTGALQWYAGHGWFNGIALTTASGNQAGQTIVSDGHGGAIVAWGDYLFMSDGIYCQRISREGVLQWTIDGVVVCPPGNGPVGPLAVSDDTGGAIITWTDLRRHGAGIYHNWDVYAQRIDASGTRQWTPDGVWVRSTSGPGAIVSDRESGAIVVCSGNAVRRVERFGHLGDPAPAIADIMDVPNDNGGRLKVSWYGSYLDAEPGYGIANYSIWRSVPPNTAEAAVNTGARVFPFANEPPANLLGRAFATSTQDGQITFWELVGTQAAAGDSGYSLVVPTTSDSMSHNPRTLFRVQARHVDGHALWNSDPDSGYSVDNLAPATPVAFRAEYVGGSMHLHWARSLEVDVSRYRLWRGDSAGFVPGPTNLIASTADTAYQDGVPQAAFYKLSAVDVHGNESHFALLAAPAAPLSGSQALWLAPPTPNPAFGPVALRLSLPHETQLVLTIFDLQGRQVRELLRGIRPAGQHRVIWDGRDREGRYVPSGLYVCRLEVNGKALTQKLISAK